MKKNSIARLIVAVVLGGALWVAYTQGQQQPLNCDDGSDQ